MTCATQDLILKRGKTFTRVLRWAAPPLVYKAITGITKAAPAVVTAPSHGAPDGWNVAVVSAQGMREINATTPSKGAPPLPDQFKKATVLTADTLALNEVNSLEFTSYSSGGALVYYTPVDLAGFSARFQIRESADSTDTPLVSLTSPSGGITIDNTDKTITFVISATVTAAIDWESAVYELEVEDGAGVVTQLLTGNVLVEPEVVRA